MGILSGFPSPESDIVSTLTTNWVRVRVMKSKVEHRGGEEQSQTVTDDSGW
jgi:hypothetical protein